MQQGHLDSSEIERVVDGLGDGANAALVAHMHSCERCSVEVERARHTLDLLEQLPRRMPSVGFQERVLAQVQPFEPWYVTLTDFVQGLLPRGARRHSFVVSAAGALGLVLTGLLLWLGSRADALTLLAQLSADSLRQLALGVLESAALGIMGEPTASALDLTGVRGVAALAVLLAGAAAICVYGLRRFAAATRARE